MGLITNIKTGFHAVKRYFGGEPLTTPVPITDKSAPAQDIPVQVGPTEAEVAAQLAEAKRQKRSEAAKKAAATRKANASKKVSTTAKKAVKNAPKPVKPQAKKPAAKKTTKAAK